MWKLRSILLLVAAIVVQQSLWAQSGTRSPYSRYAYGALAEQSLSGGHAMGGLGYGLRKSTQINPMNPASYSSVDSLTFLFDMGADFQFYTMKEDGQKQSDKNGGIKNMNLLFPLGRGFAFSGGLLPVTRVGYGYGINQDYGQVIYTGDGGFNKVYGGLAYKHGNFSVGANLGYMFGDINHLSIANPGSSTANVGVLMDSVVIRSHDFTYTLGAQQVIPMAGKKSLVIGAAYSPEMKMSARRFETQWIGSTKINSYESRSNEFEMAQSLGVGATLVNGEKWTVGADVLWENWADAKIDNVTDSLNNRFRYAAGAEYVPNARSRNFFNRVQYRIGAHYSNSYITTDKGVTFDEMGVRIGLGMPVYGRSVLHCSFDYVKVNPSVTGALSENHFRFTVSYVFSETWFRKWRLN